uniref:Fibrinogen like 2 n=1 Tax=Tetraodon nigroviridis TaxID=99883 RepID=H3BY65_TETNG
CDVTVTPEEPCEREEDDIRCPYLFNVPPLTIHLPKQLRELERMVQELQVLKDNVDELRRMCADCTEKTDDRTDPPVSPDRTKETKIKTQSKENRSGDPATEPRPESTEIPNITQNQNILHGGTKKLKQSRDPNCNKPTQRKDQKQLSITRHPDGPQNLRPSQSQKQNLRPRSVTVVMRDCSDYLLRGQTKSRVYLVTPDLRSKSFPVFCDMELSGGGWTLLQRRQDGSVSFNRSWDQYRSGFGELDGGEFWLGNNRIHLLTRERDMTLRVELEDFDGGKGFAEYSQFRVASERLRYTLTVGGYSGNAGNALRFSKSYDHHHRAFTTPDRDHDRYPSGNCGAYYSSGWWFDACMAANLNGRYYTGRYKGVRDGIYWGTWHNISSEYYPTNDRQSFKSVRMMIRPKGFVS